MESVASINIQKLTEIPLSSLTNISIIIILILTSVLGAYFISTEGCKLKNTKIQINTFLRKTT